MLDQQAGKQPEVPIEDALVRWLDNDNPSLRSAKHNESHLRALIPFVKGRDMSEAAEIAREIKSGMQASPGTINRRLSLLRRVCNLAYKEWGWLDRPVGDRITLLPQSGNRMVFLTPVQVETLAAACVGAEDVILLLAYTGLRRSELWRCERTDNDLYIRDSKTGKPRIVPMPYRVQHVQIPVMLTDAVLRKRFEAGRKDAGMPHVRLHDLRHTYASWLIQRGVSLRAAQELLGHSTLAMTQRYSHLDTGHLSDAVDQAFGHNKAQGGST